MTSEQNAYDKGWCDALDRAQRELRDNGDYRAEGIVSAIVRTPDTIYPTQATLAASAPATDQADEFRSLVFDLLATWQGYAESQFATAQGTQRLILADRAQSFLDVAQALRHPHIIEWPKDHPRHYAASAPTQHPSPKDSD